MHNWKLAAIGMAVLITSVLHAAELTPASARDLVRQTVDNELKADPGVKFMFRDQKKTPRGSQTRLLVQTTEAMAGMTIAYDGRPLNPDQRNAEIARNQRFLHDADELRKKRRQEKENEERINRIMRALPDAFLYEYDGSEPGKKSIGESGAELTRLSFRPNPKYDPPSRVEQVLTAMTGLMLIDSNKRRLARIDGTLSHEVAFGWGIFGHLDKGGHFLVEQGEVDGTHWAITRTDLAITGKVLLFKSLRFESSEVFTDFRQVPSTLSFAQGVEMLAKEAQSANNRIMPLCCEAAR